MRLDFSNIGKGLTAIAEAKKARDLARESRRYDITESAYGPELQQNIEQIQGLRNQALSQTVNPYAPEESRAQATSQINAYDQALAELNRLSQLKTPEYSIASRPQTFTSREEATRAAAPMRAEGLSRMYEQFGDIEQAEALRERADAGRLRDIQLQSAQLGLATKQRTEKQAAGLIAANQAISEARAQGAEITSDLLRTVAKDTGASFTDLLDAAAKELGFREGEATARINQLKRDLGTAASKGVNGLNKFLADSLDPDKSDNIVPKVVKNAQGNYVVQYGPRVLSEYGEHSSLEYLVGTVQGFITGDPLGALNTIANIGKTLVQTDEATAGISLKEAQAAQARATAAFYDRDRPRAGLTTQPDIKETDIRAYIDMYGDTVVGQGNNRRPITLSQLPPAEQRAYILQIIRGQEGTEGLPDIGEGGLQPRAATQPARGATDATGLGTLGRFTPQALLERAAAAGNQSAIQELRRRQEAESARGLVPYTPFSF
jgi:hypothetical protein